VPTLAEPALLERDHQLAALAAAVEAAGLRDGRLVVIEAGAGVGKTSLLQRTAQGARDAGFQVLQARAVELEHDLPFGVVRQLLAPEAARRELHEPAAFALPALGLAAPDREVDDPLPTALHGLHALCSELAARRPTALAIDDVHWADHASLRFLAYLARRLGDLPLLLVLATRPNEPGAPQELIDVLLHDSGAALVRPHELSPDATSSLLRAHLPEAPAALGDAVHQATGGNPFLIEELARGLADSPQPPRPAEIAGIAPRTVARSVLLRVGRLSGAAQQVATAVALFADGAPFRHVAALAGLDETAAAAGADELIAASVLRDGPPLAFLHPLMRTAVYEDAPPSARRHAHARAAALLMAEDAPPEEIATHLVATEPHASADTVEVLRRAAERALGVGASETAARYLRRALEEPAPVAVRPQLLHQLGRAAMLAGQTDAVEHLQAALTEAAPGLERGAVAANLARAQAWAGRLHEAVETIDVAIAEVEDLDPDLALLYHADALWMESPLDEFADRYRRRLSSLPGDLPGDTPAQQMILCYQAAKASGDLEHHDRVAELAMRALGDGRLPAMGAAAGGPVSFAVSALSACDRIDEALRALATGIEASRATGELAVLSLGHSSASWQALQAGDLAEAEAHAYAARDAADAYPGQSLASRWVTCHLINVLTEQGRLEEAAAACPTGDIELADSIAFELVVARARLWVALGELAPARSELERVWRWEEARGRAETASEVIYSDALGVVLHRMGEPDQARRVVAPLLDEARRVGAPGPIGRALLATALVADEDERAAILEDAVAHLERSPRPLLLAKALVELGAVMRRKGRKAQAREPLRRGMELARRCGAAGLEARAADELRMAHGRVRRAAGGDPTGLTAGERRVAELAAAGRSNREIAAELFLTLKTVEMHLTRVYRKLDVSSRRDLPGALAGDG